jgi:hypothetical protein
MREMRYFNTIRDKVSLLVDLYDTAKPGWGNFYNRKNEFDRGCISDRVNGNNLQ